MINAYYIDPLDGQYGSVIQDDNVVFHLAVLKKHKINDSIVAKYTGD